MHDLHRYLCQRLEDELRTRRVVVFYDPRQEFAPFLDELPVVGEGLGGLPRVAIHDTLTHLARYGDSFFALRDAVEPVVAVDAPEPLLIYLGGVKRDREGSVLMELEKGGTCYEPQLKRLARNVLRHHFTDGDIDRMLAAEGVAWQDVAALCDGPDGKRSLLHVIFGRQPAEHLLAHWLADDHPDADIAAKGATGELRDLVAARLGLTLPDDAGPADLRNRTARYVLVNEFRQDLAGEPPTAIALVPEPPLPDHAHRVAEVAALLRDHYAEPYVGLADQVELAMGLRDATVAAAALGRTDTFRFEEQRLLTYAGDLIADRRYAEALDVAVHRNRSFWVDRDVARRAQWEAFRLMAQLGVALEAAGAGVTGQRGDAAAWVRAYAQENGWHDVDRLRRHLEAWVAGMGDEPDNETALAVVRQAHEDLLRRMANGFAGALQAAGWSVPGTLHQTHIYPTAVQAARTRTAYLLVDAMRFEMGVELAQQLADAPELDLRPAIAALPTITPIGMAALLPGAAASFGVVDDNGRLAARIDDALLHNLKDRLAFLKAHVPDLVDLPLGDVLQRSSNSLRQSLGDASVVLVRSQEIDHVGEMDGAYLARQLMDTVIANVARAVRKLAAAGIEAFAISADHGHQFSVRKEEDMRTDSPGGDTVEIHRRCWIGRGGKNPPGTVRVPGARLGYDTDLDFVFPTGLGVFKAGGGLTYHHGGLSLQELIIPVITLRLPAPPAAAALRGRVVALTGAPERVTNRTLSATLRVIGDLFTTEPVPVRVALIANGELVGYVGMAVNAELDRATGIMLVAPGTEVSVGLVLQRDDVSAVRVVVLDPATDAVLAQTGDIPVQLGI